MSKVNVRLLIILLVGLLVTAGVVHMVHGWQTRRHAGVFLELAHEAKEEAKFQDAISYYNSYLKLAPDDVDGRAELGMLLADISGRGRAAYETLEEVLRRDPDRREERLRLTELAVAMSRFKDAREHLDFLLKDAPDDGEVVARLGQCLFLMGMTEKAAEQFQSPAIETSPTSARAFVLRGTYRRTTGRFDQAFDDAQKALKISPQYPDALWLAAAAKADLTDYEASLHHAEQGVEQAPLDARFYSILAETSLRLGEPEAALQWLRTGRERVPRGAVLSATLAQLLLDLGDQQEAEQVVASLRDEREVAPLVAFLEARVAFANRQWQEAIDRFQRVHPKAAGMPKLQRQAYYWQGQCHEQLGNASAAIQAYRRAVDVDRTFVPARAALARTLMDAGRFEDAIFQQQTLLSHDDAPADAAKKLVDWMIQRNLVSPAERQNWSAVTRVIDEMEDRLPSPVDSRLLRAEVLAARGRGAEAETLLREGVAQQPDDPRLLLALAELTSRRQGNTEAKALLDQAAQRGGDSLAIQLARARQLVRVGGPAVGAALRQLAEENLDLLSPPERLQLWRALIPTAMHVDDLALAQDLCRHVVDASPDDMEMKLQLLALAVRAEDHTQCKEILEEIGQTDRDGPIWHYAQALRLALGPDRDDRSRAEALQHLAEAVKMRPRWWRVLLLEASVVDEMGDAERALEKYLAVIELGTNSPLAIRRAVELSLERQDFEQADELLGRLASQRVSLSPEIESVKTHVENLVEFTSMLKAARESADSTDSQDHLSRGHLLVTEALRLRNAGAEERAQEVFGEAESAYRRAIQLAPQQPDPWIALVRSFVAAKQEDEAGHAINEAGGSFLGPQKASMLAACYQAVGKDDEAEAQYKRALETTPDDPTTITAAAQFCIRTAKPQMATALLERICAGDIDAPNQEVERARRLLALALHDQGGEDNLARGIELVEKNLQQDPRSIPDRRIKARLLANHDDPARQQQAVQLLEKLVEQSPDSAVSCFELACLYVKTNQVEKAKLLVPSTTVPEHVALHVRLLISADELDQSQTWLGVLRQFCSGEMPTSPTQLATCRRTLALALGAKGGFANLTEAITLVDNNLDADPNSLVDQRTKARLLLAHPQPKRRAEAARTLERLVQTDPTGVEDTHRLLVDYYVGTADWPNAARHLQFLEDRDSRVAYTDYLLREGQLAEAERHLEQLRGIAPGDPTVVQLQADLEFRRGQHDQALARLDSLLKQMAGGATLDLHLALGRQLESFASQTSDRPALATRLLNAAEGVLRRCDQREPHGQLALASFLARHDRWNEAISVVVAAGPRVGEPAILTQALEDLLAATGEAPARLRDLEEVLEDAVGQHPTSLDMLAVAAQFRTAQGDFDNAEAAYERILALFPRNVGAMNNLAELHALRGQQLDEAEKLVDLAIQIAGPVPAILDTRAMVYLALGRGQDALADMRVVIDEQPRPNRYFHLARALQNAGQTQAAAAALHQAHSLGLNSEQLHPLERADYYQFRKQVPLARKASGTTSATE